MSNAGVMWSWSCAISSTPGIHISKYRLARGSSTMLDHEIKTLCRNLKPVLSPRADALWLAYMTADSPQSKRDAEVLIHLLTAKCLDHAVDEQNILLPPPAQAMAQGEFLLGNIRYGSQALYPLYLTRQNFIRQIGIYSI